MNKKALLCRIKKLYYKPMKEEIYVGYIQEIIDGEEVTKAEQTKFEVNGTEYTLNLKKIISHTKNHNFIERVFTFIDENKFLDIVGEFITIDPQRQIVNTINDVELWNCLCREFNINKQIDTNNHHFNEKIVDTINAKPRYSQIEILYRDITSTIVGQDNQIKSLLSSIYFNQELFNNPDKNLCKYRQNILIKGGTGTGKTETIKKLCSYYNLPITIEDATTYTVTGYVGNDVEDMFKNLYVAADEDLETAERGIIVIDEFDKLSSLGNERNEVKYLGVQKSLLKALDGGKIYLNKSQYSNVGGFEFDTSKITFIALGAFDGIDNIIQDRKKQKGTIGFGNVSTPKINLEDGCTPNDFINYGMMSQLIGRFSQIIEMNNMSEELLRNILMKSNESVLLFYKKFLSQRNITLNYDESFIDAVSKKSFEMNCGARGLKTIADGVINKYMYDILSGRTCEISLTANDVYEKNNDATDKVFTKKMSIM